MYIFILLAILPTVITIMLVIGGIRFFLRRRGSGNEHTIRTLSIADSKEDAISQLFFLLSTFFLGATLIVISRKFGWVISWETLLLIVSVVGIALAYYYNAVLNIVVWTVGVVIWWGVKAAEWSGIAATDIKPAGVVMGLAFVALILYILGRLHQKWPKFKKFAVSYMILGGLSFTALLFILSTKSGLSLMEEMTSGTSIFASWQISFSLILFAATFMGVLFYTLSKRLISSLEIITLSILASLFALILFLPEQNLLDGRGYSSTLSSTGILWAAFFNILIFAESLSIIASGYFRREEWMVNAGALFLFLLIIVKYFDWFFTFLDKSIFFIGAGVILFVVGWFMERGRRRMLSTIKEEEVSTH